MVVVHHQIAVVCDMHTNRTHEGRPRYICTGHWMRAGLGIFDVAKTRKLTTVQQGKESTRDIRLPTGDTLGNAVSLLL